MLLGAGLLSGCGSSDEPPCRCRHELRRSASQLGWEERFPEKGPALVFRAQTFEVTTDGWTAEIEVENRTTVPWRLGGPRRTSRPSSA